eukprot:3760344-Rhodomonas_salina.3
MAERSTVLHELSLPLTHSCFPPSYFPALPSPFRAISPPSFCCSLLWPSPESGALKQDEAKALLIRVAKQVEPIMKQRGWKVRNRAGKS